MLAGLLTVATLAGVIAGPTAPQRYRIDVKANQEVDATALGGGKMTTDIGVIGWVTVTLSDTTGGRLAHIVVDSMAFPAGIEAPDGITDDIASAKGHFFHAYVVDGKVQGTLKPNEAHQLVALLSGGLEGLFPGLRPTAKVGDSWSDTTNTSTDTEGTVQTGTTMVDWTVASGAAGSFTYDGKSSGTMMREGPSPGGKQTINAKITGTRSVTGPALGPMLKVTLKTMQDILVIMESAPEPIPVIAATEVTVTALP